jgi:hypothetical protein
MEQVELQSVFLKFFNKAMSRSEAGRKAALARWAKHRSEGGGKSSGGKVDTGPLRSMGMDAETSKKAVDLMQRNLREGEKLGPWLKQPMGKGKNRQYIVLEGGDRARVMDIGMKKDGSPSKPRMTGGLQRLSDGSFEGRVFTSDGMRRVTISRRGNVKIGEPAPLSRYDHTGWIDPYGDD